MTQMHMDEAIGSRIDDIIAVDEQATPILRKIFNGLSGAFILLFGGLLVLLVVLWKAP